MKCPHCGMDTEKDIITTQPSVQKDGQGRMHVWEEKTFVDGVITQRRMDTYSYYSTGEVNVINQKVFDGQGKILIHQNIRHFKDGRQPTVEKIK